MSEDGIVRVTAEEARRRRESGADRTDWARLEAMTDEDIERAIAEDPDAAPILDDEFFRRAWLVVPNHLIPANIQLDDDVLAFFQSLGPDYKDRVHAVLREYMETQTRRKTGTG